MANASQRQAVGYYFLYFGIAIGSGLIYLLLMLLAPTSHNVFDLDQGLLGFLRSAIALPYIISWIFAAYGLLTLQRYVNEAKAEDVVMLELLSSIRRGLLWVVAGSILVTISSSAKIYLALNTELIPFFTIVINYLYVIPSLIGFFIIYRGVRKLLLSQKLTAHGRASYLLNTLIVLGISSFYIFLIYTNPTRQFTSNPLIPATYYLPDVVTVITIIIPIIITWWLGFFAAFTISDLVPYITRTSLLKGISHLLYGLWFIIFSSIIIQALLSLGSSRLAGIGLGTIFFVIYLFVILQGAGYFMIALSSNTLRKSLPNFKNNS